MEIGSKFTLIIMKQIGYQASTGEALLIGAIANTATIQPRPAEDPRSTGCCLIPKFGEVDYYIDEDNVKIWG